MSVTKATYQYTLRGIRGYILAALELSLHQQILQDKSDTRWLEYPLLPRKQPPEFALNPASSGPLRPAVRPLAPVSL